MTNFVLLERLIETDRPLVVSTGMSEEEEIDKTVEFLKDNGVEFALLHCRSTYPAPFYNLNLSYMDRMAERYGVPVGYSGHERGIAVSEAAAALGASLIERHFTLARDMKGPDHSASLEPTGLKKLVRDIRNIETSMGAQRRYLTRGEYNNRVALGKSLVTSERIPEGTEITRQHLTAKSPGKGISPQSLYDLVGRVSATNLEADEIIYWEDIKGGPEVNYDIDLDNWGVVVRHSDIDVIEWGNPDVFEFRINGADIDVDLNLGTYDKRLGIHAPEQKGHEVVDLSSQSQERREQAVQIMQDVIDKVRMEIAPAFSDESPPQIVIHPGGITREHMNLDAVPEMNDALATSLNDLDDDGVELLVENMPPLPWIYGGQQFHNNFMDADEIANFCERTGRNICYDISHAKLWCNYAEEDLFQHAKTLRPYAKYLHVADAAGIDGEGIQIGDGEIDFDQVMKLYRNFDGPIVTEIWRGHEKNGHGFKVAAERLGNHLD